MRCGNYRGPFPSLTELAYSYLLGLYLGDGCLLLHRRRVYRLSIVLDAAHPVIAHECSAAMSLVMPMNAATIRRDSCCQMLHVNSYSTHWPCLFPQHGPGLKHDRRIALESWQRAIVERHPKRLLRGLIHSDGCRTTNTVRHPKKTYNYPRYFFSNRSDDIRRIFCDTCDQLGIAWRQNNRFEVNVAQRGSVALMDTFIGPKR
jgi:hypothetical protein